MQNWIWILTLVFQEQSLRASVSPNIDAEPGPECLKAGPDGTVSRQMVWLSQTFQCCQALGWEYTVPLRSWAQGLLLTCRREFARPPRSGISHGCSNACTVWGTERSGFSISVEGWCLEKEKNSITILTPHFIR